MWFRGLALLLSALLVVACSGVAPRGSSDGPGVDISADEVVRLQPKPESRARYGNHSPYTVYGRQYRVMGTAEGYVKTGVASWYGSKFHGRKTSSGEPYDMYRMTAAHRSLPLPTWVQVENLDNGRVAVVKVNDRGPFVHDRLIDLSYGAAVVLGVKNAGTARVEVRVIDFIDGQPVVAGSPLPNKPVAAKPAPAKVPAKAQTVAMSAPAAAITAPAKPRRDERPKRAKIAFVQFAAFSDRDRAYAFRGKLAREASLSGVHVLRGWRNGAALYRVRMGPFGSEAALETAKVELNRAGVERYSVVRE